jgi:hypothetical protein
MLFSQLNDTIKVDFVAQAPVGQEWELLPQKTVTMCLQKKVEASKFAHALKKKQDEDDEKAGVPDKNWADDMDDEFVAPEAPAQVHEWFDHLDNLDKNNALFVMEDNTVSEAVGPKSLSKAAGETEGAVAIVFNGPVSERTLEIASESAIATVVGTKAGKGFSAVKGVEAWLSEIHR